MTSVYIANGLRFIFLLIFQVLILQNVPLGKINIYIYPLFIILLPLELPHAAVLLLGFVYGLFIDMFYNMDGLHTAVLVGICYARPLICTLVEPRGGYEVGQTLTKHSLGISWFLKYSGIIMFVHLFAITSLEMLSFSMVWFVRIFVGFILSMLLLTLYQYILNPKH